MHFKDLIVYLTDEFIYHLLIILNCVWSLIAANYAVKLKLNVCRTV